MSNNEDGSPAGEKTPLISASIPNGNASPQPNGHGPPNVYQPYQADESFSYLWPGPESPPPRIESPRTTHLYTVPSPVGDDQTELEFSQKESSDSYEDYHEVNIAHRRASNSSHHKHLIASDRSIIESSTSNLQTLMHLVKGNIGTGILAIPSAFKYSGLWTGVAGLMIICFVAVHCMHILVQSSHILCKRTGSLTLDYANAVETALMTGPHRLRRFAKAGKTIVSGFLIFTQFGFCCVYIVFVAENIQVVVEEFISSDYNVVIYELMVVALLIPYICVRNLATLAPFSAFANLLTITGLIIIFQYLFQDMPAVSDRPAFTSVTDLPMFFGTAIFAVEGISLVLPLENSMEHAEDFGGWNGVLNLGMVSVTALLTAMGFYGYLKYGDEALGSITLNLPETWLYMAAKLMYACAIFISYNIQFYVPIRILWPKFKKYFRKKSNHRKGEYVFRIALVLVTFGVAAGIPHLDLLISLIGASSSTALAIIIPAFVQTVTLAGESKDPELTKEEDESWSDVITKEREVGGWATIPNFVIAKNFLITLFGVLGWITGTYASILAIIEAF